MTPFRHLLRVRYGECDAQGIVFNARWGDYVDIAVTEYARALFGSDDLGGDWKLVRQTLEWRASARFDDVLDVRVTTLRIGTTSFAIASEFYRYGEPERLVTAETIYVMTDKAGGKRAVPPEARVALERGAPGVVSDHAGLRALPATPVV